MTDPKNGYTPTYSLHYLRARMTYWRNRQASAERFPHKAGDIDKATRAQDAIDTWRLTYHRHLATMEVQRGKLNCASDAMRAWKFHMERDIAQGFYAQATHAMGQAARHRQDAIRWAERLRATLLTLGVLKTDPGPIVR